MRLLVLPADTLSQLPFLGTLPDRLGQPLLDCRGHGEALTCAQLPWVPTLTRSRRLVWSFQ